MDIGPSSPEMKINQTEFTLDDLRDYGVGFSITGFGDGYVAFSLYKIVKDPEPGEETGDLVDQVAHQVLHGEGVIRSFLSYDDAGWESTEMKPGYYRIVAIDLESLNRFDRFDGLMPDASAAREELSSYLCVLRPCKSRLSAPASSSNGVCNRLYVSSGTSWFKLTFRTRGGS